MTGMAHAGKEAETEDGKQRRIHIAALAHAIFGGRGHPLLPPELLLPGNPVLAARIAAAPVDGKIALPLAEVSSWVTSLHGTVKALLAPL